MKEGVLFTINLKRLILGTCIVLLYAEKFRYFPFKCLLYAICIVSRFTMHVNVNAFLIYECFVLIVFCDIMNGKKEKHFKWLCYINYC